MLSIYIAVLKWKRELHELTEEDKKGTETEKEGNVTAHSLTYLQTGFHGGG